MDVRVGLYTAMVLEIGRILNQDPIRIANEWLPEQLHTCFAYYLNVEQRKGLAGLDRKEASKYPKYIVEQVVDEETLKKYKDQEQDRVLKQSQFANINKGIQDKLGKSKLF